MQWLNFSNGYPINKEGTRLSLLIFIVVLILPGIFAGFRVENYFAHNPYQLKESIVLVYNILAQKARGSQSKVEM